MARLVYLVQDVFFAAKIHDAAEHLAIDATRAGDAAGLQEMARNAELVVLDLRLPEALQALDLLAADPVTAGVRSVGFADHENVEVMREASARGCRTVLSKRKFSSELPALLAAL